MTKDAWLNDRISPKTNLQGFRQNRQLLVSSQLKITHSEQSTTSTYSCYMTETGIGVFLFVLVAVLVGLH